jgi:hypothetical protein
VLDADYITAAEHRARRFSGAYTGTAGTLAADVLRLIREREAMTAAFDQLEVDNQALRDAVAARMDATPEEDPKKRGYSPMAASLAGCKPAQEAAARCFDTTTDSAPTEIADSDTPAIPADWILQGQKEFDAQRLRGDGVMNAAGGSEIRPGSREFLDVLDELRNLHLRKTLDYGVDEDALSNIRSSADVVNMPAWAGCILRISDKMHRLKAYFRRGKCEFDGIEDTLKDIACYAAIALVLHRETDRP